MKNIILIGYRGVGKSTIARKLADFFNCPKLSLDELLREQLGDLQTYIKTHGWDSFRKQESIALASLPEAGHVIDCGGGIIEVETNITLIKKLGRVFWLKASNETIKTRLLSSHARLSLSGDNYLQEIESVLNKRNPLYQKTALYIIETDHKEISAIVNEIVEIVKNH